MDVAEKLVVITGAAGAIGSAMARTFAAAGARLVLTDLDGDALARTRAGLPAGSEAMALAADLTSDADIAALGKAVLDRHGPPDVVINNAAVSVYAPVWEVPPDLVDWMVEVNVKGTLRVLRQFLPAMIERGQPGHVVNFTSMAGLYSGPTLGGYSASKHAVVGLTDALRKDLLAAGAPIGVSLIAPAAVRSDGMAFMRRVVEQRVADPALRERMASWGDDAAEALKRGIYPDDVARQVLLAVQHGLFWVICPAQAHGAVDIRSRETAEDVARMQALLGGGISPP